VLFRTSLAYPAWACLSLTAVVSKVVGKTIRSGLSVHLVEKRPPEPVRPDSVASPSRFCRPSAGPQRGVRPKGRRSLSKHASGEHGGPWLHPRSASQLPPFDCHPAQTPYLAGRFLRARALPLGGIASPAAFDGARARYCATAGHRWPRPQCGRWKPGKSGIKIGTAPALGCLSATIAVHVRGAIQ